MTKLVSPQSGSIFLRVMTLCAAACLMACVGNVEVDGEWEEDVSHDKSFKRVLVVGVSHNASARCDFEMFLRTQVRSAETEAQASCNLMSTSEDLTREAVQKAIADFNADAVLATVLVQSGGEVEQGGESDTRGGIYFKPEGVGYADRWYRGGYGVYGVPVVYGEFRLAPVLTSLDGEVTIRTLLYETQDATLVYEVLTTAEDLSSRDQALGEITPSIADELRGADLIR